MGTAGKSIADFFVGAYIVGKLENHHTGAGRLSRSSNISICNIWARKLALPVTDLDRRCRSGRIISICNTKTTFNGLDVTDRDKPTGWVKTTTKVPVPFIMSRTLSRGKIGPDPNDMGSGPLPISTRPRRPRRVFPTLVFAVYYPPVAISRWAIRCYG